MNFSRRVRQTGPGILLSLALGVSALLLQPFAFGLNSVILALFLGILLANFLKLPPRFSDGIGLTSSGLLEISVVFLAFDINLKDVGQLGFSRFGWLTLSVLGLLLITYRIGKKYGKENGSYWLIGFGTAICGSSAIAAVAPVLQSKKEDIGVSMAVVNLLGMAGMILLPPLLVKWQFNPEEIGFLLGGSLHSVANVAGSAYAVGDIAGDTALTVKLARVALLSPALLLYNYLIQRNQGSNWKTYLRLPWYLWLFILITLGSWLFTYPAVLNQWMKEAGKISLTIALAAIGLKISLRTLWYSGRKGLTLGGILFAGLLLFLSLHFILII